MVGEEKSMMRKPLWKVVIWHSGKEETKTLGKAEEDVTKQNLNVQGCHPVVTVDHAHMYDSL